MKTRELIVGLERLAGPSPEPVDTAWIRRRAARRRRRRSSVRAAGFVIAAVVTVGLVDAAVSRPDSGRTPATTDLPPATVSRSAGAPADPERQLFEAARRDDAGTISLLIESGVDPDTTSRDGITALMVAAFRDDTASVEVLVESGATIDAANDFDATALEVAAQRGHLEVIAMLLDAGGDPNRVPTKSWGVTPLMEAARFGRGDAVELLLRRGADPDVVDSIGRPAVLYSLDADDPAGVVGAFRGADTVLRHPDGDPARSIRFSDHTVDELVEILRSLDVPAPSRTEPGRES